MPAFRLPRIHLLAAYLCGLLLLAACGNSENSSGLYVDLPPAPATHVGGLTTRTATGVEAADLHDSADVGGADDLDDSADLSGADEESVTLVSATAADDARGSTSQELFDDVEAFYDDYLQARANVIDRTDELGTIGDLVTENGRAEVAALLASNDELLANESFSAVTSLWLFSNIDSISQVDDDTVLIVDCTEQHEINLLDQFWAFWVTNEIVIDASSGQMRVESSTTTHNGILQADAPLGCAPLSFRERAEVASARAWTDLAVWSRDTSRRTEANLSPLIGDPLRQRVLDTVDSTGTLQVDEIQEQSTFATAGLNTVGRLGAEGADDIVIVVNTCHRFPNGRTGTDIATQASVADLPPGAEQALQFQVLLDPNRRDRIDQVIAIDYLSDRCES